MIQPTKIKTPRVRTAKDRLGNIGRIKAPAKTKIKPLKLSEGGNVSRETKGGADELTLLLARQGEVSRGQAFQAARRLGLAEFEWKDPETGKLGRFHTRMAGEPDPNAPRGLKLPKGMQESDLYRDPAREETLRTLDEYPQKLRDIRSEFEAADKRDLQQYTSDMAPFERDQELRGEAARDLENLRAYEAREAAEAALQEAEEPDRVRRHNEVKQLRALQNQLQQEVYKNEQAALQREIDENEQKVLQEWSARKRKEQALEPVYPELLAPVGRAAVSTGQGLARVIDRLFRGRSKASGREEPDILTYPPVREFAEGGEAATSMTRSTDRGPRTNVLSDKDMSTLDLMKGMKAGEAPKTQDTARAQLDDVLRQLKLRERSVQGATRGMARDTFGAPTLEQPTLTKGSLTKRRFAEGGDVSRETSDSRTYLDELEAMDDPIRSGRPLQQRTRRPATEEQNRALTGALAQGVANMPYNILGAPGDIGNLLAAPTGRQPFYGSEAVKAAATRLGIRPPPPTDPTQALLYGAGDIGSALVNPAAPVRAAARGAQAVGQGLSAAAKDFQAYNQALSVPGASYAVKPGGGNWHRLEERLGELKLSDVPLELYAPNYTGALYEGAVRTNKINQAVNDWVDTKLSKYVRNQVGTVNDPVLKQIDQWEQVQKPKLLQEKDRQINKVKADIERAMEERNVGPEVLTRSQARLDKLEQERLFIENQQGGVVFNQMYPAHLDGIKLEAELKRRRAGMPEEPVSKSEAAQEWEALSDVGIYAHPARLLRELNSDPRLTPLPSWFEKLGPEDKVYGLGTELRTSFNHVVDELRTALDPTTGLPKNLQITPEDLKNSSVEKVFKLVDDISAFRRVQQREADMLIAANKATVPVKTYETVPGTAAANSEGLRWVELKTPPPRQDFEIPENFDIVQPRATARDESWAIFDRETGKYTTTGLSSRQDAVNFLQYLDGQKDLQNALKYEGRMLSHCVGGYCPKVETGKSSIFSLRDQKGVPKATVEFTYSMTPGQYYQSGLVSQELLNQLTALENSGQRFNWEEVVRSSLEYQKAAAELNQIKGFDNGTPGEEQLPFVLDFLRSSRISGITDEGKTDLIKAGIFQVTPGQRLPGFSKTIEPGFYTMDDFQRMARDNDMPQEILDTWMGKLRQISQRGFAQGGEVNKHDAFIARNMQTGGEVSSPEEQPVTEESSASRALKQLIEPVREGAKGFLGMDPAEPMNPSEAYKAMQALGNMPGPAVVKGAAKAVMQVPGLLEGITTSIFIGPRAAQWNKATNATARAMEKADIPAEEIWKQTGNFKGPDGQWRQEISDVGARHNQAVTQGPASMVLKHPELYQAYPDLRQVMVQSDPYEIKSSYTGFGQPGAELIKLGTAGGKTENVKGLLHEMSHAIQFREGFGKGGSKATAFANPEAVALYKKLKKEYSIPMSIEQFTKQGWQSDSVTPEITKAYKGYVDYVKKNADRAAQDRAADLYYQRLLGEAEARAVEGRRTFTPEQRLEVFPAQSYRYQDTGKPISLSDLIIKRKEGGPVNKHDAFIKAKA